MLAQAGACVVSGLALGIDAAAHTGALDVEDGRTCAILGGGIETGSPPSNAQLKSRIASRGLLLSEWEPERPPAAWMFPHRNRLIAALCRAVVVVEAGPRSGALHTAQFAIDLGRELAVVPGPIGHEWCLGSNRLLQREGARAIVAVEDVLDLIGPRVEVTAPRAEFGDDEAKVWDTLADGAIAVDTDRDPVAFADDAMPRGHHDARNGGRGAMPADWRGSTHLTPESPDADRPAPRPRTWPRHVYVHVPFCARRCSYCDFAIAVRRSVPVDEYLAALAGELAMRYGGEDVWRANTLYLGGGTPSRLGGEGIMRLMDILRARIVLDPGAEVTIEANPDDVTADAVAGWRRGRRDTTLAWRTIVRPGRTRVDAPDAHRRTDGDGGRDRPRWRNREPVAGSDLRTARDRAPLLAGGSGTGAGAQSRSSLAVRADRGAIDAARPVGGARGGDGGDR